MPTFLTTPQSLTISATAGSWIGQSLSGIVPSGTTGVILLAQVTGTSGNGLGVRMTGSTDNYYGTVAGGACQAQLITGLNGSLSFDLYCVDADSGTHAFTVYLIGYFGSEATFNTNSTAVATTNSTYATKSLSSSVPSGTPAAILFFAVSGTSQGASGFRQNGSSDDFSTNVGIGSGMCGISIVGLDGSLDFQVKSSNNAGVQLMGYFASGSIAWHTNSVNVSPGTTGSFQNLSPASGDQGASGYLYGILGSVANTFVLCNSGGQGVFSAEKCLNWVSAQFACGPTGTANIPASTTAIYELGYFTTAAFNPVGAWPLYGLPALLAQ